VSTLEADLILVINSQLKEESQMRQFLLHVCVQQALVALTSSPKYEILPYIYYYF
jgi:hypothetical protein